MNSMDDNGLLKAKIEGSYDWVFSLQFLYKILFKRFSSGENHV